MTSVEDLYLGVIKDGITRHPRSLQKRIGPSEIGRPCDRWILHKLNGDGEPDRGPAWKPAVGTAVHDQLERWFNAANRGGAVLEHMEWVTEWEVTVGQIGGEDITGHSDLFHVPTGTVIDHKVVGPKQLSKYRLHGPSQQYRVQAHLYGRGFTTDGGWGPCRTVAIAFLPRDGELSGAYFWSEPHDPHLAAEAMNRANRLYTMLTVVGIDAALAASPLCDDEWCTWCRAEKRAQQRAAGGSLFDVGELRVIPEPAPAPALAAIEAPVRTCPACGWKSHERPENARDYERSFEVHAAMFCPARAAAAAPSDAPAAAVLHATCVVCGKPLHPAAAAGGHDTHPACEAPETPGIRPVPATPPPAAHAPVNLFDR